MRRAAMCLLAVCAIWCGEAAPAAAVSTPYAGTPAAVAGTIQVEHFDNGTEGIAYHDTTAGNKGGVFRSTDVDLEAASGGGYNVARVTPGEWLKYTVNVGRSFSRSR